MRGRGGIVHSRFGTLHQLSHRHALGLNHRICTGPIVAEAIFLDREELPVLPLYCDPVHDFGFLRFVSIGFKGGSVQGRAGHILSVLRVVMVSCGAKHLESEPS